MNPQTYIDCPACQGTGTLQAVDIGPLTCGTCHHIGWVLLNSPIGQSALRKGYKPFRFERVPVEDEPA